MLQINNLCIDISKKEIIKNINLSVNKGEIHALLGTNGSGKSTLLNAIMGKPYNITGSINFNNEDITNLEAYERSHKGLFLSFQQPLEIEGVSNFAVVRESLRTLDSKSKITPLLKDFKQHTFNLGLSKEWHKRSFNLNASGGERKKMEILQMLMLKPKLIMLDEIDSGLDIDALQTIGNTIKKYLTTDCACIIVSHNFGLYDYLKPTQVHVIKDNKLTTHAPSILKTIKTQGYANLS